MCMKATGQNCKFTLQPSKSQSAGNVSNLARTELCQSRASDTSALGVSCHMPCYMQLDSPSHALHALLRDLDALLHSLPCPAACP